MSFFKKFDNINKYLSFNIIAASGWLYLPVLFLISKSENPLFTLEIISFMPIGTFINIAWLLADIAFIIFLLEIFNKKHLQKDFWLHNIFSKYLNIWEF